jgi:nicotinamide mononucleotide transporter
MLESAFTLWGGAITWLEVVAFVLALACVSLTVFEIHWGWPLMIVASLLYAWLFREYRLYGDAGLQVFFALIAVWGWWQWLFGRRAATESTVPAEGLRIAELTARGQVLIVVGWALGWGLLGLLLDSATDTDVPYFDAFPTVGSVIGQVLLGRKFIENWSVWIVVNAASIALFAFKSLWLTALLYLVFLGLSLAGLVRWRRIRGVDGS